MHLGTFRWRQGHLWQSLGRLFCCVWDKVRVWGTVVTILWYGSTMSWDILRLSVGRKMNVGTSTQLGHVMSQWGPWWGLVGTLWSRLTGEVFGWKHVHKHYVMKQLHAPYKHYYSSSELFCFTVERIKYMESIFLRNTIIIWNWIIYIGFGLLWSCFPFSQNKMGLIHLAIHEEKGLDQLKWAVSYNTISYLSSLSIPPLTFLFLFHAFPFLSFTPF